MKLLGNDKSEIAVLDEGTTKLLYWGKDPVILYYTVETDHGKVTSKLCTVTKIEALKGYILTDAGNEVKIEGTLSEKISILEGLLGTKMGYVDGFNPTNIVPGKTVSVYKELDKSDSATITITVIYDDEKEPLVFKFLRSENAVTVKDIMSKVPPVEGYVTIGLVPTGEEVTEDNVLRSSDKLLEDQSLTVVYGEGIAVKVYRGKGDDDTEFVTVNVPYTATVEDAMNVAMKDETVLSWIAAEDNYTFDALYRGDGNVIGVKAKAKSASTIEESGLKLGWTLALQELEITGEDTVTVGNAITLSADAGEKAVSWSSSNDEIATVEGGIVTGVSAGEVTITATADGYNPATKVITITTPTEEPTVTPGE
jgi:hypothetical protein